MSFCFLLRRKKNYWVLRHHKNKHFELLNMASPPHWPCLFQIELCRAKICNWKKKRKVKSLFLAAPDSWFRSLWFVSVEISFWEPMDSDFWTFPGYRYWVWETDIRSQVLLLMFAAVMRREDATVTIGTQCVSRGPTKWHATELRYPDFPARCPRNRRPPNPGPTPWRAAPGSAAPEVPRPPWRGWPLPNLHGAIAAGATPQPCCRLGVTLEPTLVWPCLVPSSTRAYTDTPTVSRKADWSAFSLTPTRTTGTAFTTALQEKTHSFRLNKGVHITTPPPILGHVRETFWQGLQDAWRRGSW